ncbi:hypothetical protein ACMFMG_008187 [Clarireedia jacksonii]
MKISRVATFSLLAGLSAASPDVACSPVTTTIYQPTTVTVGGAASTVTTILGVSEASTIYKATTVTVGGAATTVTTYLGVSEASTVYSTVTLGKGEGSGNEASTVYATVTLGSASTVTLQATPSTITINNGGTTKVKETTRTTSTSLKSFKTSTPIISGTGSLLGAQITPLPSASGSGAVTEVNVVSGVSTVQVCPTGASTYVCTQAVYGSSGEVIVVNIITIDVTIDVYGQASTVTITKIASVTSTPTIPAKGTGSVIGTKVGSPSGAPYSYGNGSHPIHSTGTTGTSGPSKPTKTEIPLKPTHVVAVGQNGSLSFTPSYIDAKEGETVRFEFYPTNHSVTSCNVLSPCVPNGIFDSGLKQVLGKNTTSFIDFPVTNVTAPLFFFSREKGECAAGMVFAINPKSRTQYDNFVIDAKHTNVTTTTRLPSGTRIPSGTSRPTGAPYSRNGTYSHPVASGSISTRPSISGSVLGASITGSVKPPFPTGGSSRVLGSGSGFAHQTSGFNTSGFARPTGGFKETTSLRGTGFAHSSGTSRPSGIVSGTGVASLSGVISRPTTTPTTSITIPTTTSHSSSSASSSSIRSSSSSSTSSSASLTTSSIHGYVPYSFASPAASYVAQSYRA